MNSINKVFEKLENGRIVNTENGRVVHIHILDWYQLKSEIQEIVDDLKKENWIIPKVPKDFEELSRSIKAIKPFKDLIDNYEDKLKKKDKEIERLKDVNNEMSEDLQKQNQELKNFLGKNSVKLIEKILEILPNEDVGLTEVIETTIQEIKKELNSLLSDGNNEHKKN